MANELNGPENAALSFYSWFFFLFILAHLMWICRKLAQQMQLNMLQSDYHDDGEVEQQQQKKTVISNK